MLEVKDCLQLLHPHYKLQSVCELQHSLCALSSVRDGFSRHLINVTERAQCAVDLSSGTSGHSNSVIGTLEQAWQDVEKSSNDLTLEDFNHLSNLQAAIEKFVHEHSQT